jgi:hypothetical protein
MWLVGADQVVGLVMVVMGSRSDKNNSLAELYKSHMYYNKSHLIIPSPPPPQWYFSTTSCSARHGAGGPGTAYSI